MGDPVYGGREREGDAVETSSLDHGLLVEQPRGSGLGKRNMMGEIPSGHGCPTLGDWRAEREAQAMLLRGE